MKNNIDSAGNVTISYNIQSENLAAPGEDQIYLPCTDCGSMQIVDKNVVAVLCVVCFDGEVRFHPTVTTHDPLIRFA